MTASDCVPKGPELPLASKEESTDALRSCAEIKPVGGKPLDRFWRLGGGRSLLFRAIRPLKLLRLVDHATCCDAVEIMRIAIIDESAARASIIREGLASLDGCELFVVTERRGLVARIEEIAPEVVLMELGNPSRDVLEEYFAVSRALARPIAMFVDESDDEAIAASIDAGVSAYVIDGLAAHRIRPLIDVAVRRFNAFSRLQSDLAEARGQLAERETIDRAKRILMHSRSLPEPKAYAEMRKAAMDQGRKIVEIADAIVTAHQLVGGK